MFSFPEGPQSVSHLDPALQSAARLVIEVPHWTTVIGIMDNDLRAVTGLSKIETLADGREGAFAMIDLPAGAYNIEARLGGKMQAIWVVAQEGHETRIPVGMWDKLALTTSIHLASASGPTPAGDPSINNTHDPRQTSALLSPLGVHSPADARLFLFGRLGEPSPPAPTSWDVELFAETGESVVKLFDQTPRIESTYWSCTVDLPKGYYVLRAREFFQARQDPESSDVLPERSFYRCQPLYLCAGWESHVFLECDQSPRLATMSFNMGRPGAGFRPDDEATIAAASVLAALGTDDAGQTIMGASKMEQLLRGEMENPWLGVLAAYALSSAETDEDSAGLLADVKGHLLHEIGDHPDVRALTLDSHRMVPLDYPPMLRAGLRMVRSFIDGCGPSAIVANSAVSRVGQRLAGDSAWTAWVEPDKASSPLQASDPVKKGAASMEVLLHALSSSAPVYPLDRANRVPGAQLSKSLAEQVAIIEKAEDILHAPRANMESSVKLAKGGSVEDLLGIDPAVVSKLMSGDQRMVEEGIRHLADPIEQLDSIDEDSARAMQNVLAAICEAKRYAAISDEGYDHPDQRSRFFTPIEDQVDTLLMEARRLRSLSSRAEPPTKDELLNAAVISAELEELAERLASRAHLVIVADEDGQLLYGNKLLHDRLQKRLDPQDVLDRLHRGLSSRSDQHFQISARELSPTSPEGQAGATIDIHRTVVLNEDEEIEAHIYLLRSADARNLGAEAARSLDALLPVLTLHAATAQHGASPISPSLEALKKLIGELDKILG